jgi:LPS export ABC transporter protein LptC
MQIPKPNISKRTFIMYFTLFLLITIAFKEYTRYTEKKEVANLLYKNSVIKDFIFRGKGTYDFILKGEKIVDKTDVMDMYNISLQFRQNTTINLVADYGEYLRNKNLVYFKNNVVLKMDGLKVETPILEILIKQQIIKSDENAVLTAKGMITKGKNLEINLYNNEFKLKNVRTEIRGI